MEPVMFTLAKMARRRTCTFFFLTASNSGPGQKGKIAFGKTDGEHHLEMVNRHLEPSEKPYDTAVEILFGLIPVLPFSGKDHHYSPEAGDYPIDCSPAVNIENLGSLRYEPEKPIGAIKNLADPDMEKTCLFVKSDSGNYLFIHPGPEETDESFINLFLKERFDGTIHVSVLSAGCLSVETPLTSDRGRIVIR